MTADGSPAARVLVVDDLRGVRQVLRSLLEKADYEVLEAPSGRMGLDLIRAEGPDVVLLDLRMPGLDGFAVLDRLQAIDPDLPVVMITAYGDIDTAVEAMHRGAYHYLAKPFHHAEVLAVLERAAEHRRLACEVRSLQERLDHVAPLAELLGTSDAIRPVLEQADRVAATDAPVLILGEEGAGKELVARAIHARSARRHKPFVAVDCGAVPGELLEAELFGHERDAFPGADRQRPGQLELAAGGTLYLADVGALSLGAQGRLLRFLSEKRLQRLGGEKAIPLDVRVIAGSAVGLREHVAGDLFRRDLYDRLAEAALAIPPLRERPDDIVYLVQRLLDATNRELGKQVEAPTAEALDLLLGHPWPANVRELRHVIKRAVLLAGDRILPRHLAIAPAGVAPADEPPPEEDEAGLPLKERTRRAVERVERQAIADALRQAGGDNSQAARALGVSPRTLAAKAKRYDIHVAEEDAP